MSRIKIRKNIEIERNLVERYLMKIREGFKDNRKLVQFSLLAILVLSVLIVGGIWKYSNYKMNQLEKFELIMDNYKKRADTDKGINAVTINKLKKLSESKNFGFVNEMIYYVIGNLYYEEGKYKEAKNYLMKYTDISGSELFASMAMLKAAIASEESGNIDASMKIYKKLENKFGNSDIADQIYYNMARLYDKKRSFNKSVTYYNKVISMFPYSSFAEKAKRRLLLLSMKK